LYTVPGIPRNTPNCHYSLAEMINYSALAPQKMSELQVAEMSIVKVASPKVTKRISLKIACKTTVGDFKKMLQLQLQQVCRDAGQRRT
jgi:hypothetical protein